MINMFKDIQKKLEQLVVEIPNIIDTTISQNKDIEEMSQELLGVKMSDEIVAKVTEEEITNKIVNMLKEAFE
tara:strand:- start:4513 stop:4728 length:216 start_codon:yes stop_codon:yes gene_type:complete